MAKLSDLTVEVTAHLTVSRETAERCLRILEMYMKDNPTKELSSCCCSTLDRADYKLEIVEGK